MPSYLHLAYRRNARAAAKNYTVKPADNQEAVKKAREDFSFFCEYVANKPPASHHKDWHGHFVTGEDSVCLKSIAGPNIDLLGPRGPLAVSTPVATPNGWVPIGELQVGDIVFSEHGQLTEVVGISDYEESLTWEVVFTDGSSVRCDDQHLWKVRRMGTDGKGDWRSMTLNEIRTQKTVGIKGNGRPGALTQRVTATCESGETPWLDSRGYPRYQIPVTQPVEYPATELPLDPYLLGALLGDGSLSSNNLSLCSADPEIVERCSLGLPEDYRFKKVAKYGYNISHVKGVLAGGKPSVVREILKTLGVYGKTSIDKFIPKSYLTASIPDREALLQGLLDTDGTVASTGGVSFCTTSTALVKDVTELVQSLGGIATQRASQLNTYLNKHQERVRTTTPSVTLGIKLPDSIKPFHLHRKAQRYSPCTKYLPCRSIKDIRPSTTEKVRCIEVADTCHTFLTKDYIVSHNSAKSTTLGLFTAWAIGVHTTAKLPLQILYLSYTVEIARPKSAAIKRIIESRKYQEVFPAVRLLKNVTSNEYWSVDHKFAGIESIGDEMFTLCAAGLKGSVTSKRSHLCLIDDCIKSATDIANPDIRKAMQDNWNAVISPTMFEGGRAICLGTRFRHDDIHATTFNEQNNWRQIVLSAIQQDPKTGDELSYWPEMWSLEYLKEKKRTAPIAFSFQYMNQIVRQGELSLAPELIVKAEIATEFDSLGIGVDLSAGIKEKNDYTVMVLGGRIDDRIHIIDYRRIRAMGNLEKLDEMKELLNDWSIIGKDDNGNYFPTFSTCDVWSEAVQYQASLEADFKRICLNDEGLHNLIWHPVKGFRADKLARFRGIIGMFEERKIIFNRFRNFTNLFEELTNFGVSSHDDCVDALVWLVNGLAKKGKLQFDY
jgi:phage terminase large subunit-like protein